MSPADATLAELRRLLPRLDGVSVISTDARGGILSITMGIEKLESLGPIDYATLGANVKLNMWTTAPGRPFHARADPAYLRFQVVSKASEDTADEALGKLQFFGIYIVWYLHGVGVLETKEANRLLKDWNGKPVAA